MVWLDFPGATAGDAVMADGAIEPENGRENVVGDSITKRFLTKLH